MPPLAASRPTADLRLLKEHLMNPDSGNSAPLTRDEMIQLALWLAENGHHDVAVAALSRSAYSYLLAGTR
jgi:hypothetical protein